MGLTYFHPSGPAGLLAQQPKMKMTGSSYNCRFSGTLTICVVKLTSCWEPGHSDPKRLQLQEWEVQIPQVSLKVTLIGVSPTSTSCCPDSCIPSIEFSIPCWPLVQIYTVYLKFSTPSFWGVTSKLVAQLHLKEAILSLC